MEIKKSALAHYSGKDADGVTSELYEGRDGYWAAAVGGIERGRIPEEAMPALAALFREAFPSESLAVLPSSEYNEAQFETLREELIDLVGLYSGASVDEILHEVRAWDTGLTHAHEAMDALGVENLAVRRALGVSLKDDVVHAAKNAKAAAEAAQDYVIRRAALEDEVHRLRGRVDQTEQYLSDVRENARKAAQILIDEMGAEGPESVVDTATRAAEDLRRFIRLNTDLNDTIRRVREALNTHSSDEASRETEELIRAIWRIVA